MTVGQASSGRPLIKRLISDNLGSGHKLGTCDKELKHLIICLTVALRCWSIHFHTLYYMMFYLNVQDDNDDI